MKGAAYNIRQLFWGGRAKNHFVRRVARRRLLEHASQHFCGRLIDIGCGTKPHLSLLQPYVREHIGVDHAHSLHGTDSIDIEATAYEIPVPDKDFDCALCNAVLEHLEEPEVALRECFRVLRPGGAAIYLVPFIWHVHEAPRDFFRYSRYGLDYLFAKAGFEVVTIEALSGFWLTFGTLFAYNLERFHRGPLRIIPVFPLIGFAFQAIAYLLDRLDKTEQWTWMYLVVARRPDPYPESVLRDESSNESPE